MFRNRAFARRAFAPIWPGIRYVGDIVGSIVITEAADAIAGDGTLRVAGTITIAEGADVIAMAAATRIAGAAAIVEGADTITLTGALRIAGDIAIVEPGPDTISAGGVAIIAGSIEIAELPDQVAGEGFVGSDVNVFADIRILEAADAFAAAGVLRGIFVRISGQRPAPGLHGAVTQGRIAATLAAAELAAQAFVARLEGEALARTLSGTSPSSAAYGRRTRTQLTGGRGVSVRGGRPAIDLEGRRSTS